MSKRWLSILLSLSVTSLLFTACKKSMSSDKPLPTNYYPSIIISSDNNILYAINPANGTKNWTFTVPSYTLLGANPVFRPSPLLYNEMVYVTGITTDTIYKINAKTGVLVTKMYVTEPVPGSAKPVPAGFFTVVATPIAANGIIYLATTNDTLYAIDTGTGVAKWMYGAGAPLLSSPTVYNGNVYGATTTGHVFCVNQATGPAAMDVPIWDYPGQAIPGGSPIPPSVVAPSFVSSPSICPPYLYIGSQSDSNMYCIYLTPNIPALLSANTGELRWTYKTGGAVNSSPATFAGVCIFGSNDNKVYCLDTSLSLITGSATPRWIHPTGSTINSSPIIDNQTVYIGSYDYYLYALNIIDGTQKWNFKSNGLLKSSPLPYNGDIYIGSYDGNLYAVDSGAGTLKWSFPIIGNIECSPTIDDFSGNEYNSGISGYTN